MVESDSSSKAMERDEGYIEEDSSSLSKSLPEIFSFPSDDLSRRYEDFKKILCVYDSDERGILPREIKSLWASYLDTYMEPPNWLAVWTSKGNNPLVHKVVDVVDFHLERLEASVEVLDDDNLIVDNGRVVPLLELYPIKNQSKQFNVLSTATCLDQLRFFYTHIWKPWDVNDTVSEDWVDEHLEFRINLLTLPPKDPTRVKLERLASETAHNQELIQELDELDTSRDEEGDEIVIEKYDVYLRDEKIRKEVEILENPTLRLAKMRLDRKKKTENHPSRTRIALVNPTSFSQVSAMFQLALAECNLSEDTPLIVHATFQEALNGCLSGDVVVLPPGKHILSDMEDLSKGGSLIGMEEAIITPDDFHSSIMMNFYKDASVLMKSVTIQTSDNIRETLYLNHNCSMTLSDVKIVGGLVGIFVNGGRLILNGCSISNCSTGIEVFGTDASVKMKETRVSGCESGLVLDAQLTRDTLVMNKVKIASNASSDLYVYRCKNTDKVINGSSSLLDSISQISCESSANAIGNVTIDPESLYE